MVFDVVKVLKGAAVVATLLALWACGDDAPDKFLQALQSDPMASAEFQGAVLDEELTQGTDTALGKPVYARVIRRFSITGTDPEVVFDQAVEASRTSDWNETHSGPLALSAEKSPSGVRATLRILVTDFEGEEVLFIYLTSNEH